MRFEITKKCTRTYIYIYVLYATNKEKKERKKAPRPFPYICKKGTFRSASTVLLFFFLHASSRPRPLGKHVKTEVENERSTCLRHTLSSVSHERSK